MNLILLLLVGVTLAMFSSEKNNSITGRAFAFAFAPVRFSSPTTKNPFSWKSSILYMKMKFGAIVVAGSGKIGGHVASRNRGGAYLRTKVTPVNPNTGSQAAIRNRLSTLSTAWKGLTSAQITAWNNAVAAFKKTDIFGDVQNPSGFNLYQRLNNNLNRIGEASISTPPLPVSLPVIETAVAAQANAGATTITFTNDPVVTDSVVEVSATAAQSPGKNFVKSEFRIIGNMPALVAHVATLTTLYNAKFGAPGAAGQKVLFQLRQISNVTGQAGVPVIVSAVIS